MTVTRTRLLPTSRYQPLWKLDTTTMPWNWVSGQKKSHRNRVAERHDAANLSVLQLGQLVDLSSTGMRLKCPKKPNFEVKQILPLQICNDGQCVKVSAQVVWIRKTSFTGNETHVGFRFVDVRPGIQKAIDQFAHFGCITNTSNGVSFFSNPAAVAANHNTAQAKPAAATNPQASPAANASSAKPSQASSSTSNAQSPPPPSFSVAVEDIYQHLGLTIDATDEQVRKAYHAMAMKYHPDQCREENAEEKFRLIAKTYLVLKDPTKRAKYDAMLRATMDKPNQNAA